MEAVVLAEFRPAGKVRGSKRQGREVFFGSLQVRNGDTLLGNP
jgi:hypothetical protein